MIQKRQYNESLYFDVILNLTMTGYKIAHTNDRIQGA